MKTTSATIRLVQKLNRHNSNGEYPIYLVICWKGRVEKSTGVSCLPKYWDSKRQLVKAGETNAAVLNKMLSDIKKRCEDKKNDFEFNNKAYTASMLISDAVKSNVPSGDYKSLYMQLVAQRRLKPHTVSGYNYLFNKLCEFLGKKSFIINELSLPVCKDFARWLEADGIKGNTIKRLLCCLASVWNYAIQLKMVSADDYPFSQFKYYGIYKEMPRDYYLEKSHIVRLKEYWLNMVIERDGNRWSYRPGVEDRLRLRYSKEFGILWFLMMYKLNGSAPIELAYLKPSSCQRITIKGEDYWKIDIKRRKTSRNVHIRLKRDLLAIVGLEHFLAFSGHFVYPIVNWREGITDAQMNDQSHKASLKAIKWVRKAFEEINLDIARDNVEKGLHEPLIESDKVVMYTARHSLASQYLNTPNSTVNGLASLLGRSPNSIATYVHQLTKDEEIAEMSESFAI